MVISIASAPASFKLKERAIIEKSRRVSGEVLVLPKKYNSNIRRCDVVDSI